ncbi:hypothetical protein [Phenylobacterium sp.]|uniref:hypothetical protein n=1 Tax=Phenylobacterium sp. TaxID=1871053 RepID=UPI0030F46219
MNRHPGSRAPGSDFADRLQQRGANDLHRKRLAASIAQQAQERTAAQNAASQRHQRDIDHYLSAAQEIPLYQVGDSTTRSVSNNYSALMRAALRAMNGGEPEVLLCWPAHQPCLSALVALLAICETTAVPRYVADVQGAKTKIAERPTALRAILYPYARTAHALAREVHVDRNALGKLHMQHLSRSIGGDDDAALKDYHQVLTRASKITGRGSDGNDYVELTHPILDEIVPHGTALSGCAANGELLWYTRTKTDLKKHSRSGAADKPESAKFYLFGIRANDPLERELRAIKTAPDIVILDLSKAGRARFGFDWLPAAKTAVESIRAAYPKTGILALTDDPWTYDAVRFDLLGRKTHPKRTHMTPAAGQALLMRDEGILASSNDAGDVSWRGAASMEVDGFVGQLSEVIGSFRAIGAKLRDRGNRLGAEAAGDVVAKLRRSACLPGSLADFSSFLEREAGEAIAADNLAAYRIEPEVAALLDVRNGASLVAADELENAISKARTLLEKAETATSMSTLVEEAVLPAERASSRTVVLFRTEAMADFCAYLLGRDHPKLHERLENGFVRFTTKQGFLDLAALEPTVKNHYKRAVFVAPTRHTILQLLAQVWLPHQLSFLADGDTLKFAARDAARLADQLQEDELVRRLRTFSAKAATRLRELGDHQVELDRTIAPTEDVEFPAGSIIDLAGPNRRTDTTLLELVMENGQRIIARPGTLLVSKDSDRAVARFVEVAAKDVQAGDELCVIGPAFIEKARGLLNLTAAAAEEIRDYHQLVLQKFNALPGGNQGGRLRELCQRMSAPDILPTRAHYWIDLEREAHKPLYEVIPHAPQDENTFRRFTAALEIGPTITKRFWIWAVIAQRSSRHRAGAAFHDAYRGILTDPHAVLAENRERDADIRALRAVSHEFVARVAKVRPAGAR